MKQHPDDRNSNRPAATALAPGRLVTPAHIAGLQAEPAPPRLDAAFMADQGAAMAMVGHWTQAQLYAVAAVLRGEADRRLEGQLLDVMRALFHRAPHDRETTVISVEFHTDSNDEAGVGWDDQVLHLHCANGSVARFAFDADECDDEEFADLFEGFQDLLAAYTRTGRPEHNANLMATLTTGTFEVFRPSAF